MLPGILHRRKLVPEGLQEWLSSISGLDISGGHDYRKKQPRVSTKIVLTSLNLFPRVLAPDPHFSVALTD
jgi:hypothetical protein